MARGFDRTGEFLAELSRIGRPRISRHEDGSWHAALKYPTPDGVTAEVHSRFDHPDPDSALICLFDRIGELKSMLLDPATTALPDRLGDA